MNKTQDNTAASSERYSQIQKNTVDASNQLKDSKSIRFINPNGSGKRIMFVGNSITLHGVKESIGWYNEWGMAASAREKDYVHLLMKKFKEADPDAALCICQVADWERSYKNDEQVYEKFAPARDFCADIIICRFVENCSPKDYDSEIFTREYTAFVKYLNKGNAKLILSTSFWAHPADADILKIGALLGCPVAKLGDLGEDDEMKAIGLFSHEGVAIHPGDKGMKAIAQRIWDKL